MPFNDTLGGLSISSDCDLFDDSSESVQIVKGWSGIVGTVL